MYHSYIQQAFCLHVLAFPVIIYSVNVLNYQAKDLLGFSSGLVEFRTVISNHHRHQAWCHRHWHSGYRHLSPVAERSGTVLDPLIPVPDWVGVRHSFPFWYLTDRMPDSPAFSKTVGRKKEVHPAGIYYWLMERDTPTLNFHTRLLMVLYLL
jgi:hypothetical protein